MKCSIQLFELTLSIESKAYDNQLNRAYDKARRKDRCMEETEYGYADESLLKKGISFAYHDDRRKKKIRLIVYPGLVIGNDMNELWKPSADNVSELRETLEKRIASYFNGDYGLDDFKVSRVIIAADIDVGSPSKASDYIKVLHNLGRVKCFSPLKRDKDGEKINKESCFALKGNSNGVEFQANQLKNQKNILRVEVRLTKTDTIRAYSGETDTSKRIKTLAKNCDSIFMDTFRYIIPPGEHYKKPKAEKLIRERVPEPEIRRRMLRLLTLIPEKKSLHLALKSMNYRNFRDVILSFEEIDVSPVTISKRQKVKKLESLYHYLV